MSRARLVALDQALDDFRWSPPPGHDLSSWIQPRRELRALMERHRGDVSPDAVPSGAFERRRAFAEIRLAELLEQTWDRAGALEVLDEARAWITRGNPARLHVLDYTAEILRASGDYESALNLFDESEDWIEWAQAQPEMFIYPLGLQEHAHGIAQLYMELGMLDVAEDALVEGFEALEAELAAGGVPHAETWATLMTRMLTWQWLSDDFEGVEETYAAYRAGIEEDARRHAEEGDGSSAFRHRVSAQTDAMIELRLARARLVSEFRDPGAERRAVETIQSVLEREVADADERLFALGMLAHAQIDRGRLDEARAPLDEAAELLEQLTGERRKLEVHVGMAEARLALLAAGSDREANRAALEDVVLPLYETYLAERATAPVRAGGVGYLHNDFLTVLSLLARAQLAAEDEGGAERAVRELLRSQALGSLARENRLAVPTLEEVRSNLTAKDQGIVWYVAGREGSFAFAIDDDAVTAHALPPAHRIVAACDALHRTVVARLQSAQHVAGLGPLEAAEATEAVERASKHEHERGVVTDALLPAGLQKRIRDAGWKGIRFLGLGAFGYVPMELLEWDDARGPEALGRFLEVSYLDSLVVALWLRERRGATPPLRASVFAADGKDRELGYRPLTFRERELSALVEPVPGARVLRATAFESSLQELLRGLDGGIAQFIAHGHYEHRLERPAALFLHPQRGRDGLLFADQVEALGTAPDLAILTACGAARSKLRRGDDGRGSLGGAFFQAGSSAVIFSATDLELSASLEFTGYVYEALARGETVAAALLAARRKASPGDFGVDDVHSFLMHVHGDGDLSFRTR